MKSRVVIGSIIILMIGFISCQKNDSGLNGSLDLNLYTSVAEIIGIQISNITASTEQGVSVERFNGWVQHILFQVMDILEISACRAGVFQKPII